MAQLPSQSQFGDYGEWPGRDVLDSGGERLGGVREIYLDRETGRPEWVLVDVDGDESRFVPLADAAVESSTIRVAHSAAAIRNAPGIGAEPRIDQTEERRLYDHYGIGYHDAGSGLPAEEPTREHDRPDEPAGRDTSDTTESTPVTETASAPETPPLIPPWRTQDTTSPAAFTAPEPEPKSSWSAAARDDETSNLAPPPADPPSPSELAAADIPEPPAVTDRAPEPGPIPPAALDPASPSGLTTPSGNGEILATGAGEPEALAPAPEPEALLPGPSEADARSPGAADPVESELTAQHGPDVVGVFSTPSPPTPPAAAEPGPVSPPPPAPDTARPRPFTPPPAPEPPAGGALAVLKSRRGGIAAGVTLAAVLFFIVRKLR
jgi:hypothetical protein